MEEFSRNVDGIIKGTLSWVGQIIKHAVKVGEEQGHSETAVQSVPSKVPPSKYISLTLYYCTLPLHVLDSSQNKPITFFNSRVSCFFLELIY
jgi:hypothetical protein